MTQAAELVEQLHELWGPGFASPELVDAAVGLFPRALPGLSRVRGPVLREGPLWYVEVAAGCVAVRWKDARKQHDREAKELDRRNAIAKTALAPVDEILPPREEGAPSRRIVAWSPRSRARMVQRLAELDLRPLFAESGVPAMVTLTLPGDWQAVAPTAADAHRLVKLWRKRYERAWDRPLHAVWKREFQERGAPHWHLLMVPPQGTVDGLSFREWLSKSWADVVGAQRCQWWCAPGCGCEYAKHRAAGTGLDFREGARATDPKRLGIYFAKHGAFAAKEYQNVAPAGWVHEAECSSTSCEGCAAEGVGRYWGVWRLRRHVGAVEVSSAVALAVMRTMRRHARANRYQATERRWRREVLQDQHLGEQTVRWKQRNVKVWRQQLTGGRTSGFLLVNDGPAYASQLGRVAEQAHAQARAW